MSMSVLKCMLTTLGIVALVSCSKSKSESAISNDVVMVKTQQVQLTDASGVKDYVGTVEESSASALSFEVAGNVQQVLVSEGQQVHKGQLLAILDKSSLKSAHDAAVAMLRQAEDANKRLTLLHDNNSLPDIKYIEMQTNLEKARSSENIARKNLRDASLYAPFAGVIGERSIEPGMNVLPSQSVLTLLQMNQMKVKVTVPENEIAMVRIGQKARITIAALNNCSFEGVIDLKGVVANPLSHTYEVKIRINQADPQLMPGMVCKVLLQTEDKTAGLVLPNQAIQVSDSGQKYVWLARDGKAERQMIETGELTDNGVTVTDGLRPGDQVIVEGWQKIGDGSKIKAL